MDNPSFTVRHPVDLVALAPHLLGFRPRDSVLLMTFGGPGGGASGAFHARVDLPTDADGQCDVANLLLGAVLRNGARTAAVLVFSTDVEAARLQAALLVRGLLEAGVRVLDVLRVEDERYFGVLDDDETGTPYDISAHPFTARRVYEGQVVQPSREALADTLVGTDEDEQAAVAAAAAAHHPAGAGRPAPEEAAWLLALVRECLATGRVATTAEAGRLLADCGSAALRDAVLSAMDRASAAAHVGFWRDVVRRAPDALLPPAAALLGFAAWLSGDGALAWCAADRCLEHDPEHVLAHRLAALLTDAVPPSSWDRLQRAG